MENGLKKATLRLCACGCGNPKPKYYNRSGVFKTYVKYIPGHYIPKPPTENVKILLAKAREKNWKDPAYRVKMARISSVTMKKTNDRLAAGEFPEWKKKHSEWSSKSIRERWANGEMTKSQHRKYFDFRSKLEWRFSKFLEILGLTWEYEPRVFSITLRGKLCSYTPDFYIPTLDCWVETKGFWRDDAKERVDAFIQQYPDLNFLVVYGNKKGAFKVILENQHFGSPWKPTSAVPHS